MVAEIGAEHESEWAAMSRVAELLGVGSAEAVRKWVRRDEVARTSRADHPRPQLTRHSQDQQVATKINYWARRGGFGLRHPFQAGTRRFTGRARVASPAEREALWPRMVGIFPLYEEYAHKTDRQIPVVLLTAQD